MATTDFIIKGDIITAANIVSAFNEKAEKTHNHDANNGGNIPITSVSNLQTELNGKQPQIIFGTTSTAAATAIKAVNILNYGDVLNKGDIFAITFTVANTTAAATTGGLQIQINNAPAVQVRSGGGVPTATNGTGAAYIAAGMTVPFFYDGAFMMMFGSNDITDLDTTYSTITQALIDAGTSTTGVLVTPKLIKDNFSLVSHIHDDKQDKLTAGINITISGNTISATDTTYTNGSNGGLSLSGTAFSLNTTASATVTGTTGTTATTVVSTTTGTANRNYRIHLTTNGLPYVTVPWLNDNTIYTHPDTAGNKHLPSGGSAGQILGYDSAGTAKWVDISTLVDTGVARWQ